MKRNLVCLTVLMCASAAYGRPMSRVLAIHDSRTLLVQTAGRAETVTLRGVDLQPEDEAAAAEFLRRLVSESWVYVENGDVYRSPDGLYVNNEMARHAWRETSTTMKYLGEMDLAPRKGTTKKAPSAAPKLPAPAPPPKATSRTSSRPRRKRV